MTLPEFKPWPKIPRNNQPLILTEKIDGTNAIIHVGEDGAITAGCRTRWLVDTDNFGFAAWCRANATDLALLGPGYHYGEWYGAGIQRTYGLTEKRFALFNVTRWQDGRQLRPACCGVVPLFPPGTSVAEALTTLRERGSMAVPGWMRPEGVVIFHTGSGTMQKALLENPNTPKSLQKEIHQ